MSVIAMVVLIAAVGLVELGRWGRRHSEELAPRALSMAGRQRQAAVLRRGATTCQLVGVLVLVGAVALAFRSV